MTTFTLEQKLFAFDAVWMIDRLTTFGDAKTFAFFPLNTGPPKGYSFRLGVFCESQLWYNLQNMQLSSWSQYLVSR